MSKEKKRKGKDEVKRQRRMKKISKKDNSTQARQAYSRHDGGISPDEVNEDISPEHLDELKQGYCQTKVVVTPTEVKTIEINTRQQADSPEWLIKRRKRITSSMVGGIAKMRSTTKRAKKVENLLYTKFRGNAATRYGSAMEETAKQHYQTHQQEHGHPGLRVNSCGLCVSLEDPWLAASPDGLVKDPSDTSHPLGLVEIKNPYATRSQTLMEASKKSSFCLEHDNDKSLFKLKTRHDYYFQIQTQLYCTGRHWCDFVLRMEKELLIEQIYVDATWQHINLPKLKKFYFSTLLPELASPRHHKGGIRESA